MQISFPDPTSSEGKGLVNFLDSRSMARADAKVGSDMAAQAIGG